MKCSWTIVILSIISISVLFPKPCQSTFGTIQQSLASLLTGNGLLSNNGQSATGGLFGRLSQQPNQQFNNQQQLNVPNGIPMTIQTSGRITGQQLQTGLQQQTNFQQTGLQQQSGLTINGAPATFGTNIGSSFSGNLQSNGATSTAATFNSPNRQSMSARILDGLIPGLGGGGGGLFGGGSGNGVGGGLPGIPPGMTVTGDGCLCPMPKAKTKYIAVEVPQVIFVPPKEKTKIITIKEVVSEKAPPSSYDFGGDEYMGSPMPEPGADGGDTSTGGYGDSDR